MIKVRKQRGTFADSMETMLQIEPTWEAIEQYFDCPRARLLFHKSVFDDRKGWEAWTYLVVDKESGVLGMSSLPIE